MRAFVSPMTRMHTSRPWICAVALLFTGCGGDDATGAGLRFRSGSSTSTGGTSTTTSTSTSTSTTTTTSAGADESGEGGGSFIEPQDPEDLPRFEADPLGPIYSAPSCCEVTCDTGVTFCRDDDEACSCDAEATLACNAIDNSACASVDLKFGCTCADPEHTEEVDPQCYRDCGERSLLVATVTARPEPGELVPIEELCARGCDPMRACVESDALSPLCVGTCEDIPSPCELVDADGECDPQTHCAAGIDADGPYCDCIIVGIDCQCGCSPNAE